MGVVELGEELVVELRTNLPVKRIPIATPAFLQDIRRPIGFDGPVERLGARLADPPDLRMEDAVGDPSCELALPAGYSGGGGFTYELSSQAPSKRRLSFAVPGVVSEAILARARLANEQVGKRAR